MYFGVIECERLALHAVKHLSIFQKSV